MAAGYINNFVCLFFSTFYPVFASFRAIESDDKNDDTQWLTFWVTFGFFSIIESVTSFFESFIPFYFEIKLIVFLLLQLPQTRFALVMYNLFVKPYFENHRESFDEFLKHLPSRVFNLLSKLFRFVSDRINKDKNASASTKCMASLVGSTLESKAAEENQKLKEAEEKKAEAKKAEEQKVEAEKNDEEKKTD